jgi:hypothetical protein
LFKPTPVAKRSEWLRHLSRECLPRYGSILRAATAPAPSPLHARIRFFLIRAPRGLSLLRGHPSLPHGLTVTRIAGYADGKLTACVDLEHFRLRAPLGSCRF